VFTKIPGNETIAVFVLSENIHENGVTSSLEKKKMMSSLLYLCAQVHSYTTGTS
jgi:hypothetical protein